MLGYSRLELRSSRPPLHCSKAQEASESVHSASFCSGGPTSGHLGRHKHDAHPNAANATRFSPSVCRTRIEAVSSSQGSNAGEKWTATRPGPDRANCCITTATGFVLACSASTARSGTKHHRSGNGRLHGDAEKVRCDTSRAVAGRHASSLRHSLGTVRAYSNTYLVLRLGPSSAHRSCRTWMGDVAHAPTSSWALPLLPSSTQTLLYIEVLPTWNTPSDSGGRSREDEHPDVKPQTSDPR